MNFITNKNEIVLYNEDQILLAEVTFPDINNHLVNVNHTFVHDSLRGQGIAGKLMILLAKELRKHKKKAVFTCSYAASWFEKNKTDYQDIIEKL